MHVSASLSRRNFIAAAALTALGAALPGLALAEEKAPAADDKAAEAAFDPTGTWVLIGVDCNDEDTAAILVLVVLMATATYEFKKDGTLTFKVEVAEGAGSDTDAAAEELTGEKADEAEAQADETADELFQNTEQKGTWELVSDTELTVTTDDGATENVTVSGLSLVSIEQDEGLEVTSVYARPEDLLSGAWAIATYPDVYDADHEGIVGSWNMVAMEGMTDSQLEDAKWSANIAALGMSVAIEFADDGTFTQTATVDENTAPETAEGTWEEKGEGVYTLDDGTETIEVQIVDGTLRLESEGTKIVLAPLA